MKGIIVGGGGFMGSHLNEALLAAGYEVVVFDRPDARYLDLIRQTPAWVITGDFLDPVALTQAMADCDVVFHLASTTVPQTSNDDPAFDVRSNIVGSLGLLDAARKARVKKIVFASSGGTVYGIPQETPIKETHPTEPTSSHGICKLAIEKYLHYYQGTYGLEYCILRIANAYGERQPVTGTQGVIPAFLDKVLRSEELIIWGDGSIVRDYVYVKDITTALLQAALTTTEFRLYNIGSGQGHSLKEIIVMIETLTGRSLKCIYTSGRSFDVPVNVLDITRARTHLGWQPAVDISEGLARTYEWMRQGTCKG